jgi:hypothetical protein
VYPRKSISPSGTLQIRVLSSLTVSFSLLYDKISREDILAHAFAQCRSNKGAPGVDWFELARARTRRQGRECGCEDVK